MISHHPPDELLFDLATGAQPLALALAVAGHLDYCPSCRGTVADFEALGGALLSDVEPVPVNDDALEACLARLDDPGPAEAAALVQTPVPGRVPAVLDRHLDGTLADLPWRSVGGFFDEVKMPEITPGYRVSLLRVAPGRHVPEHGHEGNEFMLVLNGGYQSGGHHYRVGDFAACDGSEDHTPIADEGDDCICLLILDAPLAFRTHEGQGIEPLLAM